MATIDLSHINLLGIVEQDMGQSFKKEAKCHVGPCPFCGDGTDRFVVWAARFWCRKCSESGDAINYLRKRRGLTFPEACKELGVSLPGNRPSPRTANQPLRREGQPMNRITLTPERESKAYSDEGWQTCARIFCEEAHARLMADAPVALSYLQQRGLSIETIEKMRIGFNDHDQSQMWGETRLFIPEGLVFPWDHAVDGLRRVNFRPRKGPHKYRLAEGSAQAFYMGDRLTEGCGVVLMEGEFDALTVLQAYANNPKVCPIATGSVTHGRVSRLIARLALAKRVVIAFDADAAGKAASAWWRLILPDNSRIVSSPFPHKDCNSLFVAILAEEGTEVSDGFTAVRQWLEGS